MAPRKLTQARKQRRSLGEKNTHPEAASRREAQRPRRAGARMRDRKNLDAQPDRVDVRDWIYQPTLSPLRDLQFEGKSASTREQAGVGVSKSRVAGLSGTPANTQLGLRPIRMA